MNLGMLGSDIDPEKTAFVSLPQNRRYTYGDIQSISDTVAAGLSRKYQFGDRIAVIGLNSADYIATVLGIMKAGMVAVPVNWKLPDAQIRDVLNDGFPCPGIGGNGCHTSLFYNSRLSESDRDIFLHVYYGCSSHDRSCFA